MMKNDIKKLMTEFQIEEGDDITVSAKFAFPDSFIGFSGHFPGNSVLPGVCQIECVLLVISEYYNNPLQLTSLSRAKFLNIVKPDEIITVKGTCKQSQNTVSGRFRITKECGSDIANVSRISINAEFQDA